MEEKWKEKEFMKTLYNFYLQGLNDGINSKKLTGDFKLFYRFINSYKESIFSETKKKIFENGFLNNITLKTVLSEKEE